MSILRHPKTENRLNKHLKGAASYILPTLIGAMLLLAGCKQQERAPKGLLSKGEMVNTLAEMMIAEEKVNTLALKRDSSEKVFAIVKTKVLDKLNVSDSNFRESFQYYLDRPKELEEIYTMLVDSLQLREQRSQQPVQ